MMGGVKLHFTVIEHSENTTVAEGPARMYEEAGISASFVENLRGIIVNPLLPSGLFHPY